MPTHLLPASALLPQSARARIAGVGLDNCFTGWDQTFCVNWMDSGHRLTLKAHRPLDYLVVYAPGGGSYFCAEPVSHCTDAFNRAADGDEETGIIDLPPGQATAVRIELSVATPGVGE